MKIAVTLERRSDGHKFVREYEPETIDDVTRWLAKYDATCDVVSFHADEELRIAMQSEADAVAKMNAEVSAEMKGLLELMVEIRQKESAK